MTAAALALALALAAAGPAAGAGEEETPPPEVHGAVTSGGSFYVEWSPEPSPVPLNELFAIRFRVLEPGESGEPLAGAVVTADAWMPDHNHGTTLAPRVESHGDGTATGEGFLFHMEGRWQLRVGVAAGGRLERAVFEVELGP